MILRDVALPIVIVIIIFSALIGWSSALIWGPDNEIEEDCEDIIKKETGVDIDLTPKTKEEKK